jgi:hypothetical protein
MGVACRTFFSSRLRDTGRSNDNSLPVNWKGTSFVPIVDYGGGYTHNPITVFGGGKVGIKFGRMRNRQKLSVQQRTELLRKLNAIPGVELPADSIERFPSISLATLAQGKALEQFLKAIEWVNDEVRDGNKKEV